MTGNDAKRTAVANAYDGKAWKQKVKGMSEEQIVAIYMRLKLQGKIT